MSVKISRKDSVNEEFNTCNSISDLTCTFIVEDESIYADKKILAERSIVFEKMFFGHLSSSQVEIIDIGVKEFRQLIKYCYTNTVNIQSMENAWSLVYVARKYMMDDLLDFCCKYIRANMTLSCLLCCFEHADLYNLAGLKKECWTDMLQYTQGVFGWDYHIRGETWKTLLSAPSLATNEVSVIREVTRWAIEECKLRNVSSCKRNIWMILSEYQIAGRLQFQKVKIEDCDAFACLFTLEELDRILAKPNWYKHVLASVLNKYFIKYNIQHQVCTRNYVNKVSQFHLRSVYKIDQRFALFANNCKMSTVIGVNQRVALFGIAVTTEHEHNTARKKTYIGGYVVEIYKNKTLLKKFEEPFSILKYDSVKFISFNTYVELIPDVYYTISVKYKIWDKNLGTEVISYYLDDCLKSEKSSIKFTFVNELCGSFLRGLSFYPL